MDVRLGVYLLAAVAAIYILVRYAAQYHDDLMAHWEIEQKIRNKRKSRQRKLREEIEKQKAARDLLLNAANRRREHESMLSAAKDRLHTEKGAPLDG